MIEPNFVAFSILAHVMNGLTPERKGVSYRLFAPVSCSSGLLAAISHSSAEEE
jgi:hypothetical protein